MSLKIGLSQCRVCGELTEITTTHNNVDTVTRLYLERTARVSDELRTHAQKLQYAREVQRTLIDNNYPSNLHMSDIEALRIFHNTNAQHEYLTHVPQNATMAQIVQMEQQLVDPAEIMAEYMRNDRLFGRPSTPPRTHSPQPNA